MAPEVMGIFKRRDLKLDSPNDLREFPENSVEDNHPGKGEIKAFPLVCVTLPEYWMKIFAGEDLSA